MIAQFVLQKNIIKRITQKHNHRITPYAEYLKLIRNIYMLK